MSSCMLGAVSLLSPVSARKPGLMAGSPPDHALMTSQESILQRIAKGDQAAVQECIDAYGNLIWSLARRFLRNSADAEDAVQDVFIDVWNSAGRFDPAVGSETTFVSTIARRRFIDRLRKHTRTPGMDSLDDEETGALNQPFIDAPMEHETDAALVERILAGMEPEHRQILSLSLYEGYSHSEIAEQMDLPLGTVKTRIRRGLMSIREQLNITVASSGEAAS